MRIVICSPLNIDSAIGRMAVETAHELLARGHVVDLVSTELERPSDFISTDSTPTLWSDPKIAMVMDSADIVVVHIGDNFDFHAGAIYIVMHWRCVGIFHDANIYGLFRMWAFHGRNEADGRKLHDEMLLRYHGIILNVLTNRAAVPTEFHMISWLAAQCSTVLAHSKFYGTRLRAACPGQTFVTPLTYSARTSFELLRTVNDSSLKILTIGHVNENKCCGSVIEAMAASPTLCEAEYRIAGPVSDPERDRLMRLANAKNIQLKLLGRVTDDVLAQELADTDIVSCLRRPILEGASASAIEAMLSAKPIVVVNSGFYADIADDAALKIPLDFKMTDLKQALERLAASTELRLKYGQCGRAWAVKNCDVKLYVDVLLDAMQAAIAINPFVALAKSYAQQLLALGLIEADDAWEGLAGQLQTLVDNSQFGKPLD
jgi:glycosyltransferase involved in cell wall biosynthesis